MASTVPPPASETVHPTGNVSVIVVAPWTFAAFRVTATFSPGWKRRGSIARRAEQGQNSSPSFVMAISSKYAGFVFWPKPTRPAPRSGSKSKIGSIPGTGSPSMEMVISSSIARTPSVIVSPSAMTRGTSATLAICSWTPSIMR